MELITRTTIKPILISVTIHLTISSSQASTIEKFDDNLRDLDRVESNSPNADAENSWLRIRELVLPPK
jgi:hypothetical protein